MSWRPLLAWLGFRRGGAGPAPPDTIRLVDLTDEFDAFWERSQVVPPGARVTAFKAQFARLLPGFYDPARVHIPDAAIYESGLERSAAIRRNATA